jgi:hypothetical protein
MDMISNPCFAGKSFKMLVRSVGKLRHYDLALTVANVAFVLSWFGGLQGCSNHTSSHGSPDCASFHEESSQHQRSYTREWKEADILATENQKLTAND